MHRLSLLFLALALVPTAFAQSERQSSLSVVAWPTCAPAHVVTRLPCVPAIGFALAEMDADAPAAVRHVQAMSRASVDPYVVIVPCFESEPMVASFPMLEGVEPMQARQPFGLR